MIGSGRIGVGLALVCTIVGSAQAQISADLSLDEAKCQVNTTFAVWKSVYAKAKCIISCEQKARRGGGNAAECLAPFGGETLACVQATAAKGEDGERKKCAKDCPECFTGGDCNADATARVGRAAAHVDTIASQVYCDDSGSPDGVTKAEGKCQDTTARSLTKYAYGKLKCIGKCRRGEFAGKIPAGNCELPTPFDPKTVECIAGTAGRARTTIDKFCEVSVKPDADEPECGLYPTSTAADALALVDLAIAAEVPTLFCGSPSGAFAD